MGGFPKKVYILHSSGVLLLSNVDENNRFLSDRIEKLKQVNYDKIQLDAEIEKLFIEFIDVYDFDKKNAVLPEPLGQYKDEQSKREWIEKNLIPHTFNDHIGTILANFHEWLADIGGLRDYILDRHVTDYPSAYSKALADYICVLKGLSPKYPFEFIFEGDVKKHQEIESDMQRQMLFGTDKAYFASFALPMLIEHYLIGFIQMDLVDRKVRDLFRLVSSGDVVLDADDLGFMKSFLRKKHEKYGDFYECMTRCHDILKNCNLVSDDSEGDVIKGKRRNMPLTLGSLFKNEYMKQHVKPAYYNVLEMLFGNDKLNLRNSIMHGVSETFDPYSTCFVAVMLQLFWSVIDRSIFA